MEDIRTFERETQLLLQRKMGMDGEDDEEDGKNLIHLKASQINKVQVGIKLIFFISNLL